MNMSYLVSITTAVVSFAINLYRLYLAVDDLSDVENIAVSLQVILVHLLVIFLNNHNGQKVITSSTALFREIYDSLWYRIPPKSQKLLLFMLMRSNIEIQFNLAGLFVPCYQGFTMMVSSSFSYFTVITSI
ncbi:uncharacterized protein LOC144477615 isoform X2 [Augochlora pura]